MAGHVREVNLSTREARQRLSVHSKPYYRALDACLHLGYRKGSTGSAWVVRWYKGDRKAGYGIENLDGRPDDVLAADDTTVLSWNQAQHAARQFYERKRRVMAGVEESTGPYTVTTALDDYLKHYGTRGKAKAATESAANAHIRPTLGTVEVVRLTTPRIRSWLDDLANSPPRVRVADKSKRRKNKAKPAAEPEKWAPDPDTLRRRRATANRVLTILKAALNHAWREGKVPLDVAWRRAQPFYDVDSPLVRYLTGAQCLTLVNATAESFRPMVRAALLSGCRYGELTALRVNDFNADSGRLLIRTSKSGKSRHTILTDEGQRFFADATNGKAGTDLIFTKSDGKPWGKSHQQRPLIDACKVAKITPAIGFHVLRHTHASTLAMKGVPLAIIAAQLGHADSRMTERHYAHLSPSHVADTIRANFPDLGIVPENNIEKLRA